MWQVKRKDDTSFENILVFNEILPIIYTGLLIKITFIVVYFHISAIEAKHEHASLPHERARD